MNHKARAVIGDAVRTLMKISLDDVFGDVETLADEEREKFDNLNEGLQQAEKGQAIDAAATALSEAKDKIAEARDAIEEAINYLGEAGI